MYKLVFCHCRMRILRLFSIKPTPFCKAVKKIMKSKVMFCFKSLIIFTASGLQGSSLVAQRSK